MQPPTKIIQYPHPTLRRVSKNIARFDADLRTTIRAMFDLMYEAKGVGLAANQVDLPLRLFVVNVEADPEKGEEMVFINPVISMPRGGQVEAEEGCLSLPGVYAEVKRPKQVRVNAFNMSGEEISADVDGFLARVIQHETDHLDGVMFIDRLSETAKFDVGGAVQEFETAFESEQRVGEIPPEAEIFKRLDEIEARYC